MKQINEIKRMQQLAGLVNESFNKDMEDIALAHSNTSPNTPPGATAGTLPKGNQKIDELYIDNPISRLQAFVDQLSYDDPSSVALQKVIDFCKKELEEENWMY